MPSLPYQFLTDPHVQRLIRRKAREMVGQFGFTGADREDIEQELRLDILKRSRHYDHTKSSIATFSTRIITHRIASLIAERQAGCRDWRLRAAESSYEEFLDAEGSRSGRSPAHEAANLRIDLARVLSMLSPAQRAFCLRLRDQNIAEIAAETGIPASTLYDMRRRIRRMFRELETGQAYFP